MELSVREAAGLMNVSERTLQRWIRQSQLPAYKVNDQYRFNRAELLEWATAQGITVSAEIFAEPQGQASAPSLAGALRAGGIHYGIGGGDKATVLKGAIEAMPLPADVDRAFLLSVLLAREDLGSTAVGDGIAIPHVRNPIVMHIPTPMIALCFLTTPIDFGALDGKPVHVLFTLVSPTVSAHLSLLSRLAHGLHQESFCQVVARQAPRDEILKAAESVESRISTRKSGAEGAP
jgi:PTS system nitrogen regulatory IIA component